MTNYPTKKLEDCLNKVPKIKGIKIKDYLKNGLYPIIDQGQEFVGGFTNDKNTIYKGKLPVIIFGDHTRIFKYTDFPFALGADGTKILLPKENLNPKYFYLALLSLNIETRGYARHYRILKEKEIPLPPIEIQKKIVERIEKMMAKIDEAKKLRKEALADASTLIPSALNKIFEEGKMKEWEDVKVGDVCEKPQYGYTESAKLEAVGPKFLRITDIQKGNVDWENVPYCFCNDVEKYQLKNGDIVFARTGATVGKSYLIKNSPKNAVFASYLIRLRATGKILPDFLYYFFQSPDYWRQITQGQVGGAQPNVNGTKLAKIKFPLPPLPEQQKIVKYLDSLSEKVRKIQTLQSAAEKELKLLEKGILSSAFAGEF